MKDKIKYKSKDYNSVIIGLVIGKEIQIISM